MEKLELSASELIEKLNWKKSKVYYWINSKKFETIETPEGVKALLTEKEIGKYRKDISSENFENVSIQTENFQEFPRNSESSVQESLKKSQHSENEVMMEAIKTIRYMYDNTVNQTKLLTDSEHRTKEDYYEIKAEFKTLQESYKKIELEKIELSEKISMLEKELSEAKQKSFFGLKFGK